MTARKSALITVYHVKDGAQQMYEIDARHALRFGKEWSQTPWKHDGEKSEPIIEIPEDWADMSAHERIALAVKLGADRKGLTAARADEIILDEAEHRAETPGE